MNLKFAPIAMLIACLCLSCAEPNTIIDEEYIHEIPLSEAKNAYVEGMMSVKDVVQQVFIEALQIPELNGNITSGESVDFRTNCPEITDHNPDEFPKHLTFDFGNGCLTDNGAYAEGIVDVYLTAPLKSINMLLEFVPNSDFSMEGNRMTFTGPSSLFNMRYVGNNGALDKYSLNVEGLEIVDSEDYDVTINSIVQGDMTFQDINKNNEELGLIGYADDVAYLDFSSTSVTNYKNEVLAIVQLTPIKVDLFCDCPKAGEATIVDGRGRVQHVNFTGNEDCNGKILVDAQERDCR